MVTGINSDGSTVRRGRIVVGMDGSPESLAALEWSVREARCTHREVDAVLAYDTGVAWIDVGSEYESAIKRNAEEHARAQLDHALAQIAPDGHWPVAVRPNVVAGIAAEALVDFARDADLLVVGARGRGAFAGLLLGSTSQRCAERSACPVVVVPGSRARVEHAAQSD